jgi:hypothetical protein
VKIQILDEAKQDLIQGFRFYENQEPGLGSYFLDSLFSDVDSLRLYAGIHQVIYGACPNVFPLPFTTASKKIW